LGCGGELLIPAYWSHSASGLLSPDHPCRDDQVATRTPFDPHAAVGGPVEAFEEVLISAIISSSRTAWAAWSMSIIIARWKCATAGYCVQTLERLTSPGTGGSSPTVPS
jgi:hypothetical protein